MINRLFPIAKYVPEKVDASDWGFVVGKVNGEEAFTDTHIFFLGTCPETSARPCSENLEEAWNAWQPETVLIEPIAECGITGYIWFSDLALPIQCLYYDLALQLFPQCEFRRSPKAAEESRKVPLVSTGRHLGEATNQLLFVEVWSGGRRVGIIMPLICPIPDGLRELCAAALAK